jgi:pyrimidine oxygenase
VVSGVLPEAAWPIALVVETKARVRNRARAALWKFEPEADTGCFTLVTRGPYSAKLKRTCDSYSSTSVDLTLDAILSIFNSTDPSIKSTIDPSVDNISGGRFGINLITGWQRPEYAQMGLWPGDDWFVNRYNVLTEYTEIMRELWSSGRSDFKGEYYKMEDCRMLPRPQRPIKLICAGSSSDGLAFSAKYVDYNFCIGDGVNTPKGFAPSAEKLRAEAAKTGRDVGSFVLTMVIADETDEAAFAKWEHYKAGADTEALAWLGLQASADKREDSHIKQASNPKSAINFNMGTLVGSFASVARMLDEMATVPGAAGVLLTFDDFLVGIENFGTRIQPLMSSRRHIT